MDNPFKTAREALRLSHKDVAEKTGLSKLYVIRQEQGVYANPSDKLIQFYIGNSNNPELNDVRLFQEYREFQSRCRLRNGPTEKPYLYPASPFAIAWLYNTSPELIHPMKIWMNFNGKVITGIGLAKAYCVSPAIIQRFLAEPHRVKTFPDVFEDVLVQSGYSVELIRKIDEIYRMWRRNGKAD